jgi:hypothetical protein
LIHELGAAVAQRDGPLSDKIDLTLCRTSVQNGETIPLVITRPATAVMNGATVRITSTLGAKSTSWLFDVGN